MRLCVCLSIPIHPPANCQLTLTMDWSTSLGSSTGFWEGKSTLVLWNWPIELQGNDKSTNDVNIDIPNSETQHQALKSLSLDPSIQGQTIPLSVLYSLSVEHCWWSPFKIPPSMTPVCETHKSSGFLVILSWFSHWLLFLFKASSQRLPFPIWWYRGHDWVSRCPRLKTRASSFESHPDSSVDTFLASFP